MDASLPVCSTQFRTGFAYPFDPPESSCCTSAAKIHRVWCFCISETDALFWVLNNPVMYVSHCQDVNSQQSVLRNGTGRYVAAARLRSHRAWDGTGTCCLCELRWDHVSIHINVRRCKAHDPLCEVPFERVLGTRLGIVLKALGRG